jgi:hypothetical protein
MIGKMMTGLKGKFAGNNGIARHINLHVSR